MSQIIYPITHLPPVIDIGKQTEKGVTRIGFDVHEWLDDWPGMRFSVQPTRPGETESYTAATDMVGSVIFWLVGAVDTEKPGSGTVEVLGVTEDERKLSFMCRTAIANTNTVTTAEIPEPGRPWVDQVIMAGETAKEKAKEAADSAVSAFQSEQTAGQHSVNAEEKARSAAQSELEATKAMNMAVVQADDAKAYAKAAEESAKSADDSGRLAQSMSDSSRENANAASEHALSAQQNASEAAKSAAEAAESVKDFYVVTVTEKNGVQMASSDAMTIWQMAEMGKVCLLVSREHQRTYMYTGYADGAKFDAVAQFPVPDAIPGLWLSSATVADDGTVMFADELPAKTPNPHKLTLTGGVEAEYDGSEPVNVKVQVPDIFVVKAANPVNGVYQLADKTQAEIRAALNADKVCLLMNTNSNKVYTYYGFLGGAYVFKVTERSSDDSRLYSYVAEVLKDGTVRFYSNIVTAPNPKHLRFTGAVKASYYGGEEVTVEIPAGGGGAGLPETADPLKQLVTDKDGKVGWADRLAYKYTGEVVNLEPTELLYDAEEGCYLLTTPWARELVGGEMYTVSINGTDYACKAIDYRDIQPDIPFNVPILGNTSILGIDHPDSNPDAPFFVMAYSNVIGAQEGGYGAMITMEILSDYTLAVRSIGETVQKIDHEYLPDDVVRKTITLTVDSEGNVTSDTDFETAWGMDSAALQAAIVVETVENIIGGINIKSAATVVLKRDKVLNSALEGREIEIRYAENRTNPSDNLLPVTKRLYWYEYDGIPMFLAESGYYPSLPKVGNTVANTYLKWDGYNWTYVPVAQVKADLGVDDKADKFTVGDGLQMADGVLSAKPEGVYELIETITLEEDAVIARTEYNLYHATLDIAIPPTTQTGNVAIHMDFSKKRKNYMAYLLNAFNKEKTDKGTIRVRKNGDGWQVNFPSTFVATGGSIAQIDEVQLYPELRDTNTYKVFTGFKTAASLPAGTEIKVWGVRADA